MNINPNIAISDTGFVFDPSTGDSFSSNPIGAEIIQLLKQDKSVKEIVGTLKNKYDVDETQLDKDITDFILTLEQYNLVQDNE